MPTYIILYKYTAQGLAHIKDSPKRIAEGEAEAAKMGIRQIGVWLTMGQFDLVSVAEAPDDETMARFQLSIGAQGNVTGQTLRGFTPEEFQRLVGGMPS